MNTPAESPLLAIVGPTASGKSALAIWLAERLNGEIIACDSTQLYRGFDIGTAKPSLEERRGIPHHLLDVLEPHEEATAGGYRERALVVLTKLREKGRLPIFTVGTGLYLRALLEGLAELPLRSEELRDRLRNSAARRSGGHLHRILQHLDPIAAQRISSADQQKLLRAIEVCLLTRKPMTEVFAAGRKPLVGWRPIKIGLMPERELLYARIHRRTEQMLVLGWLDEVQGLLQRGIAPESKGFDFIGYRQLHAVLRNDMSMDAARAEIQQGTRRYAKRQLTWFRREPDVQWFNGFADDPALQEQTLRWVSRVLDRPVSQHAKNKV